MFQVICIATGTLVVVYAVSGGLFLVWKGDTATDQHWEWAPMNQFRPVTVEDRMRGLV